MAAKTLDGQAKKGKGITGSSLSFSGALNKGTRIFDGIVALSVVFIVGSTVMDIISRTVFLKTLPIVRELSLCLLVVIIWGGAVYTLREKAHVNVTILTERLKPRSRALLKTITCGISALCCIFGTYSSWFLFKKALALGMVTPVSGIPTSPLKGLILVAFVLLTLQFLVQGFESLRQFRSRFTTKEEEKKEAS